MDNTLGRRPLLILLCGGIILMLSLGTRQTFGLFLQPMSLEYGWGRETFALAIAVQNLVWGLGQPFAGAVADKVGAARVLAGGSVLYALGLYLMAGSQDGAALNLSAGLLIGLGLSGSSFGVVMGVVGRAFGGARRSVALGIVGAGGSFGQFAMLPYGQTLIAGLGWQHALWAMGVGLLVIVPLAIALAGKGGERDYSREPQSLAAALQEAAAHRGYWFLTFSFLVCGFQTIFIMIHLPAFLTDKGLPAVSGVTALALIGLFNVVGSYLCGVLGGRYSKKRILSWIYFLRAGAIAVYIALPVTQMTTYVFATLMGLTWLGTVPLTNGLVAQIFGVQYLATLFSIAFLGHQVGSFLGAWYGGYMFDLTGSYQAVWMFAIALSIAAGILCLPIDERLVTAIPAKETAA
ncbi:MAG: MFS transporter [Betaproteobacteria bacterium]|nr:MFS transporter [Betaproteobacteria bacterium]